MIVVEIESHDHLHHQHCRHSADTEKHPGLNVAALARLADLH
jgi:hypothetical protein